MPSSLYWETVDGGVFLPRPSQIFTNWHKVKMMQLFLLSCTFGLLAVFSVVVVRRFHNSLSRMFEISSQNQKFPSFNDRVIRKSIHGDVATDSTPERG